MNKQKIKNQGSPEQNLRKAIMLHQEKRFDEARALFLLILEQQPSNVVSLYSLAAIESSLGSYAKALEYANRAIESKKDFAPSYFARSVINFHLGELKQALADLDEAVKIEPSTAGAAAHRQLISAAMSQGDAAHQKQLIQVRELSIQGLQLQEAGKTEEAVTIFQKVLTLDPLNYIALYSMGVVESRGGNPDAALSYLNKAVEVAPGHAQAHYAIATALQGKGLFEEALAAFDKAIEVDPAYLETYNNKTTLLHAMGRQKDALLTAEAALQISPNDERSLHNKGYLLTEFKHNAIAAQVFRRLLDLNPKYDFAEGLHALARLHTCDWSDYEHNKASILAGLNENRKVCNPFSFLAISDSAASQQKAAQIFGSQRFPASKNPLWQGENYRHRKKRVAFISSDFREHPVGYLLIGLIESFDKSRFETIGVSLGIRDGSELYRRYRNSFDYYLSCGDKPGFETAQLIKAMEVDIAIDLSGYTSGSRLDILSYRPAPVQITYLGYSGTLSVPYIDYLIADQFTIPDEYRQHYGEKILDLPRCFLPRDLSVTPAATAPSRAEFGLPNDGLVFCSFNHDYKLNPPMFDIWLDLINENPKSVLWLMKLNEDAQSNLLKYADSRGIDPKRLVFATRVPRVEDHLARIRYADVCLDTFPYNGHTTTSDALFAGVPVVSMAGEGMASRIASSLLNDLGKKEWIVEDYASYKAAATRIIARGETEKTELVELKLGNWPPSVDTQAKEFCELLSTI
jgi:predicted O-linked N-acetylglucosamine transferase (SPINDLY family)